MSKILSSIALLLVVLIACNKTEKEAANSQLQDDHIIGSDHPISDLQFPIDYPVNELELMMNRIMPDTLVNDSIDLNDKGDVLVLKIIPLGELLLNSYQDNLDASIPVEVLVNIKKKILAFNVKNKKPIKFKLRIDIHLDLTIDENFDLASVCKLQKIHWIEAPKTDILGLEINLQNIIDKQLNKNAEIIENAIANALNKLVPIKKEVLAIWHILNVPHRVAKKPVEIWLSTEPETFNAWFDNKVEDTIRAIVSTKSAIIITPIAGIKADESKKLPLNPTLENQDDNGLNLKVTVSLPYIYADSIINDMLSKSDIDYQGVEVVIKEPSVGHKANQLALDFTMEGIVNIDISATAEPALNNDKELIIRDINYNIKSDNALIESIDWLTTEKLEEIIQQRTRVPLSHILDSLDNKIIAALNKSKLGSKIALDLNFSSLESDTIKYFEDGFEWYFDIHGKAHAFLNDSVVNKRIKN